MVSRLDRCTQLCFLEGKDWRPFPAWAHFLIRVGWELRRAPAASERLVIAVCLPHRGFATGLAALGALLAEPLPHPEPEDIKRHFTRLLTLPDPDRSQTAFTYLHAGRKIRGLFAGAVTQGNTPFVKVCIQARSAYRSGGLTHFVGEADAINLQIERGTEPVLGRHINGTALAPHTEFVNHFYSRDELHLLHLSAHCQVIIIGRINSMREETTQIRCGVPAHHDTMHCGVLNDILRVRKFLSQTSPARTAIFPKHRDAGLPPEDQMAARLVIFDGADAFTKWSVSFPAASFLVVLDPTETQFQEGVSQLNSRYYLRSSEFAWPESLQPPHGLEATGFFEVRR
jgi:hypothetical protein